jgi:hypothetical protein
MVKAGILPTDTPIVSTPQTGEIDFDAWKGGIGQPERSRFPVPNRSWRMSSFQEHDMRRKGGEEKACGRF